MDSRRNVLDPVVRAEQRGVPSDGRRLMFWILIGAVVLVVGAFLWLLYLGWMGGQTSDERDEALEKLYSEDRGTGDGAAADPSQRE